MNPTIATLLHISVKESKVSDIFVKRTEKSRNYLEIELKINNAVKELKQNKITVGHCLEIIAPYCF